MKTARLVDKNALEYFRFVMEINIHINREIILFDYSIVQSYVRRNLLVKLLVFICLENN